MPLQRKGRGEKERGRRKKVEGRKRIVKQAWPAYLWLVPTLKRQKPKDQLLEKICPMKETWLREGL